MFRLVGLYVVGAWVVIQVAEALFQAWGVPDTAMRFVFIAALLCFPIALVFGWIFDITSEGIVRTRAAGPGDSVGMRLQRADYLILAALVLIGAVVMAGSAGRIQEEIESGHGAVVAEERVPGSIAVLPFRNLDAASQTAFFSDGVTEEILHRLSTLGTLHVLASGSSFSLRDSELSPAQISETLGVYYLLDGSIRRLDNNVRVTARLLDSDGFQVWSETFDRELTGIFAVQAEIANAVSRQIADAIVPLEAVPAGRTTDNMEAYTSYLLGRYEAENRGAGWKVKADASFRRALELDPDFAPPYAGLAMLVVNGDLGRQWNDALQLADKALELDPELAEAHAIKGLITTVLGDPDAGLASLERAIDIDPSLSIAYNWLALPLSQLGRQEEAHAARLRGLERDPLNPPLVANVADSESLDGNFDRAEQLLLRLARLDDLPGPADDIIWFYDRWSRYADGIAIIRSMALKSLSSEDPWLLGKLAVAYGRLGMTEQADYWIETLWSHIADPPTTWEVFALFRLYDDPARLREAVAGLADPADMEDAFDRTDFLYYGGLAQIYAHNYATAVTWIEGAVDLFLGHYGPADRSEKVDVAALRQLLPDSDLVGAMQPLAFAYRQVGRPEDAARILAGVDAILDDWEPKDPLTHEQHALQRALYGDIDGAVESLRAAAELGWANVYEVTNSPAWAALLVDKRVQELLAEARRNLAAQRARVESMPDADEFRSRIAQLLQP